MNINYERVERDEKDIEYMYCDSLLSSNKKVKSEKSIERLCEKTSVRHEKMEILYEKREIKPYFDYDYKSKDEYTNDDLKEHLDKCENAITLFFGEFVKDWNFDKDVAIAYRHGKLSNDEYKISYRFYIINGCYTTLEDMNQIIKTVSYLSIFDHRVYNNNRKIAMLFGHKSKTDKRVLLPLYKMKWNQKDFIIQYVPVSYKYELSCPLTEEHLVTKEKKVFCDELMNIKELEIPKTIDYNFDKNDLKALLTIIPNDGYVIDSQTWIAIAYAMAEAKQLNQTIQTFDELRELFIQFSKRYPNCNVENDCGVFNSCIGNVKYNVGVYYIHKVIGKVYPNFWKVYMKHNIGKQRTHLFNEVYNEDCMREYDLSHEVVAIKANPGVGKTVELRNTLNNVPKDSRICVISYNVVLCKKYHEMFGDLGFKLYNEESNCNGDRIIICLDSLYRITKHRYDYVIVDEVLSVLMHLDSSVMKKPNMVINTLTAIFIKSKHIVFLDANVDEKMVVDTVKWIEEVKETKAYYINNEYVRPTNRKVILMEEKELNKQIAFIMEKLNSGKKIVVPVSSKDVAEKLYMSATTYLSNLKVKKYDSESSRMELYNDSKNPNDAWKELDLLIYTPTIGAGVSFENSHFDISVCLFESSKNHASVFTCYQQMFRVRQLKDGYMYVFIHMYEYDNLPVEESSVEYMMKTNVNKMVDFCKNVEHLQDVDIKTGNFGYNTKKLSYPVIKNLILLKNQSMMYFNDIFRELISSNDIPIFYNLEVLGNDIKLIKKDVHEKFREEFLYEFEECKEELILSMDKIETIEKNIQSGSMDVSKEESIKMNITRNLEKWGCDIDEIDKPFYKEYILAVNANEQRDIDKKLRMCKRYQRLNEKLQYSYKRVESQYSKYDSDDDINFKIYKNQSKTGHQQMIASKKVLMYVFEVEDGNVSDIFNKRYKNVEWKERLNKYINSLSNDHWKYILSLYGLEVVKKRKKVIDYSVRELYGEKCSSLCANFMKTMMRVTYGIDFNPDNSMFMKFDDSYWKKIKNDNITFLNKKCRIIEVDE
jgi:hypothetical protein